MMTFKMISRIILILFFLIAGINHFINPDFYIPLIPDYLPFKELINYLSGLFEVAGGIFLISPKWRYGAAFFLMLLMILFIPSHIYFIQLGSCIPEGLCVDPWIAWARLLLIHPLIVFWIWKNRF